MKEKESLLTFGFRTAVERSPIRNGILIWDTSLLAKVEV